jgi:pimeloyl-ACP methyl ester carboxylesterase
MIISLQHARVRLALHRLQAGKAGSGTPLLLLHELAGSAADWKVADLAWSGPVYALDSSGHGHSGRLQGGAYVPERWCADADLALAALGDDAWIAGAGVSAYVALLLAGARPSQVRGAVLLPGRGLEGGGTELDITQLPSPLSAAGEHADPAVYFSDAVVRPPDRAQACAEAAGALVLCEGRTARPPWWRALYGLPNVRLLHGANVAMALHALVEPQRPSSPGFGTPKRRSA